MKYLTRATAVCLAFLALFVAGLRAGGASAASDAQLTIAPATHETIAPAVFTADEMVVLWYNLPDGTAAFLTQATALDSGALDFTIDSSIWDTIPADATTLVAHGDSSGVEAVGQIVRPGPAMLSVDTSTMVATAGAIFAPTENVSVWYNLPNGTAATLTQTTALADGSLNWTIDAATWASIPSNATSLVAHGDASGVEAVYVFAH